MHILFLIAFVLFVRLLFRQLYYSVRAKGVHEKYLQHLHTRIRREQEKHIRLQKEKEDNLKEQLALQLDTIKKQINWLHECNHAQD